MRFFRFFHVCTIFNSALSAAPPIPLLSENERRMTNLENIDCLVSISQSILASHLVGGALLLERLLVVLEVAVAPRVRGVQRQHLPGQLQGSSTTYGSSITYRYQHMCYETKSHRTRINEVGKFADLRRGKGGFRHR